MSAVPVKAQPAKTAEGKTETGTPTENNRRGKMSDLAKYTDVKRTSSASFKPPMSKDNLVKPPIQPPQKDSSWFAPFSYIKTMFVSKPVATTSSTPGDKSHKSDQINNMSHNLKSNLKDAGKYKKYIRDTDSDTKANDRAPALGTEGKEGNLTSLTSSNDIVTAARSKSPSFSVSPKDAITKRDMPKQYSTAGLFDDEDVDPTVPKYKKIQSVDNQSTYLHAPDKKGTTSFRITTVPQVGLKQLPTLLSPSFSSQAQQKRPVKLNRKGSTSPHKTRTDIGSARLRSKSTPDSSSIKPRPVSVAAIPKSLHLKNTSQKHVPSNSEVKEIGPVVTNAKTLPKPSFSFNANKLRENISMSHPRNKVKMQKSPITINHTSTNAFAATKTTTSDENTGYESIQNVSCSNSTLRGKLEQVASPKLINHRSTHKSSTASIESPTFLVPSMPRPARNKSVIEKYQDSLNVRKIKMKSKSYSSLDITLPISQEPLEIVSAVQKQSIERNRTPPMVSTPRQRKSSEHIMVEGHPSMTKTVTLCKSIPKRVDSNFSFSTNENSQATAAHEEFKAIQMNNKLNRKPRIDDKNDEAHESTQGNQKHHCIRMVNSSQYHPKHPTKPQVVNLSNRKTSSFTNLLVADRKDQQSEREVTGELVNSSYNTSSRKHTESSNQCNSIPTLLSKEVEEDLMLSAPSFYDTSNSASCYFYSAMEEECDTFDDYDIDSLICDENLVYQNTCNSAHRGDTVKYCGEMSQSHVDDTDDDVFSEGNYGRPSRRRSVARKIADDSIPTSDDRPIPECTSSTFNGDNSPKAKGKRKYPYDLQYEKIQEREHNNISHLPSPSRKPVKGSTKELSSKSKTRISYLQSGKSSQPKQSSTLQFLHQNERVDAPTVLEPSTIVKPKVFATPSSFTPTNNFNSIASSVGEAIGAITSAFQSSFMSMVSPTKSPNASHLKQNSPKQPEIRQTSSSPARSTPKPQVNHISPKRFDRGPTKIVEKPMSATRSYVSSVLEEKGISKSVQNGISTLKTFVGREKSKLGNEKKNTQDIKHTTGSKDMKNSHNSINDQIKSKEPQTIEKKQTKANDNIFDDLKKINSTSPDRKKRFQSTERDNKRNDSPLSALGEKTLAPPNISKDMKRNENTVTKNKSNQSETNIVKPPTTTPPATEQKSNSKTTEIAKPMKNVEQEKLKSQTIIAPEKAVPTSPAKKEPAKVDIKSTEVGKDAAGDKTGKDIFAPLIVVKIPDAPENMKKAPVVKKQKRNIDPDVFSSSKSHFGEL